MNSVGWTLGSAAFYVDADGNVFLEDRYNFNAASDNPDAPLENRYKGKKFDEEGLLHTDLDKVSKGKALYAVGRNAGTKWGSPDKKGAKVSIHVGHIDDFGLSDSEKTRTIKHFKNG